MMRFSTNWLIYFTFANQSTSLYAPSTIKRACLKEYLMGINPAKHALAMLSEQLHMSQAVIGGSKLISHSSLCLFAQHAPYTRIMQGAKSI